MCTCSLKKQCQTETNKNIYDINKLGNWMRDTYVFIITDVLNFQSFENIFTLICTCIGTRNFNTNE